MKRFLLITALVAILALVMLALAGWPTSTVQALPEYSAQTGEPCATCHVSPSGGGPRGPRGQAWVGSGKPGTVPDLVQALEVLGVHLEVDLSTYTEVPESIPAAQPLQLQPGKLEAIHQWLSEYNGN